MGTLSIIFETSLKLLQNKKKFTNKKNKLNYQVTEKKTFNPKIKNVSTHH